ncbi:acetoacetyl-coenzyme A synthetase [Hypoxylon cercidicola]|nr:acetoacetyl-coenzyme A synthetase [Hypoxylon cercidicola]
MVANKMTTMPRKLWEHPNPEKTQMYELMQCLNKKYNIRLKTFQDLYQFSIDKRSEFFAEVFEYGNIIHTGSYTRVVDESKPIDAIPRWFEGVHLNWTENILWSRKPGDPTDYHGKVGKEDSKIVLTEVREGVTETRHVPWVTLRKLATLYATAMYANGVRRGDRIVVVGSNSVETLVLFLATGWLGAIFSSSSTDMGVQGILQRTVQVDPKYIFMDDAALYNGKRVDLRQKMADVVAGMEGCTRFSGMVSIRRFVDALDLSGIPKTQTLETFIQKGKTLSPPPIVQIAFHDPFLICYSSGTTGIPKAIVHSVGGALLNYVKETRLHEDCTSNTVSLQYTTTGWIMYLVCVSQLLIGARVILYDGSPFQPDLQTFIKLVGDQKVTKLGTSPRWFYEIARAGISPRQITDLSNLRTVSSTGMVLSEQLFEWFYDKGFPSHIHLNNISGGTDIAGCFGIGNPLCPVYVGGTQGPSLGVKVALYDSLLPPGPGKEVPDGTPGELVATASFPNVPVFLWGDKTPAGVPGSKLHSAYFARYNHVWAHGDFCVFHPVTKNLTFLGRADGVLNPSGVRFGSAEIYTVLERNFADRIADSICVGQRRPQDNDESVMLFLLMRPGHKFDRKLVNQVKEAIKKELTKRHVPKYVFETPEIPTTVNLKKVELPVKQIVSGQTIKPSGTLLNPKSLDYYYQFAKVEELVAPKEKL